MDVIRTCRIEYQNPGFIRLRNEVNLNYSERIKAGWKKYLKKNAKMLAHYFITLFKTRNPPWFLDVCSWPSTNKMSLWSWEPQIVTFICKHISALYIQHKSLQSQLFALNVAFWFFDSVVVFFFYIWSHGTATSLIIV